MRRGANVNRLTFHSALFGPHMITSTVLFRRALLAEMSEWFDPTMDLAEDGDFFLRLMYVAGEAALEPQFVSLYRVRGTDRAGGSADLATAYRRALDKAFALPDLPGEVLNDRPRVYANYHVVCACRALTVQDTERAGEHFSVACEWDAAWVPAATLKTLVRCAGFRISDPRPYIEYAFDHLPESLASLRLCKKEAYRMFLQRHALSICGMRQESESACTL